MSYITIISKGCMSTPDLTGCVALMTGATGRIGTPSWRGECVLTARMQSSSKSALHGLIHLTGQGVQQERRHTVNGIAPALIRDTATLPRNDEGLAKSENLLLVVIETEGEKMS